MKIGDRQIVPGCVPYIIAELGVNHDGSPEKAIELTRAAAKAGADAVKLQLFDADRLMSRAARLAIYQKAAGEQDPIEMLRRLQLPIDAMHRVAGEAHRLGIHAIVTVFSTELVTTAERAPWDAFKSASPDLVHRQLLLAMARTGKPLIVSTGAATLDEVVRAARWLGDHADRVALMQCVSSYPTPDESAAIAAMAPIARATGLPVGYSDHTAAVDTGALAVAAGACLLEKHVTYRRTAIGPDHAASLEPDDFAEYVRLAHRARAMLGSGSKHVLEIERDVRHVSRQSLTAAAALPPGHRLLPGDVTVKRPGTGVPAYQIDHVLGRALRRAVEADMPLTEEDLA